MTGLEKIVEKIMQDYQHNCEKILEDGSQQVKAILASARAEAKKASEDIVQKAQAEADKKNAIAKSSAESITRNRYLEIRNAILNDIISATYESLERLSDSDYFELIKKLCYKHFQEGECEMLFSASDLYRLPEGFEDELNSVLFEKGAVHVCGESADIENGFILKYDGYEVNCTLKAVFDEEMDNLKYTLSKSLFN